MNLYNFLRNQILPLDLIEKSIPPKGKIFDLGCGQGLIAQHIAGQKERLVTGIDADSNRLPKSDLKNLKFIFGDIRKQSLNGAAGVVISDVLHHLERSDQKILIENIYKSLNKNGILIIKEIDTDENIRSALSRLWDFIFYPKDKIAYWSASELNDFLTKLGFRVRINRPTRFFPGSTTLFICKKY